jgi:hypothetical protein
MCQTTFHSVEYNPAMCRALPIEALRELSTLFTRPLFSSMGGAYSRDHVTRKLDQMSCLQTGEVLKLRDLFDMAFAHLASHYRNEYVFKSALAQAAIPEPVGRGVSSVQIELPVFTSILDVATASDTTTAFEIKTEFDSSRRLESQTNNYLKAFDRVFVVGTEKTLPSLSRNLDSRVGLMVLHRDGTFSTTREASQNRDSLQARHICWGLRKKERLIALERRTGVPVIMPGGLLGQYCEQQFASIPSLELHDIFVDAMRKRSDAGLRDGFIHSLPKSLRALGYATPLSGIARRRVLDMLDTKVSLAIKGS